MCDASSSEMEMLSAGPCPFGAPATGRKSGRMVMSGLRDVTSWATAVISPVMLCTCDLLSGFFEQPARRRKTTAEKAATHLKYRANFGEGIAARESAFWEKFARTKKSGAVELPREFFTTN